MSKNLSFADKTYAMLSATTWKDLEHRPPDAYAMKEDQVDPPASFFANSDQGRTCSVYFGIPEKFEL